MKIKEYKKILPINKEEILVSKDTEDSEILMYDECSVNDFR